MTISKPFEVKLFETEWPIRRYLAAVRFWGAAWIAYQANPKDRHLADQLWALGDMTLKMPMPNQPSTEQH